MKSLEEKAYKIAEKLPSGNTQLQMTNNTELEIEGCKKIIEYDENMIEIKLERNTLKIFGSDLKTTCFSTGYVTIYGKISSLEFEEVK